MTYSTALHFHWLTPQLTDEKGKKQVDLPVFWRRHLHLDVDVEARLQRSRTELGKWRKVVRPLPSTKSLEVLLPILQSFLAPSYFLTWWKKIGISMKREGKFKEIFKL